MSNPIADIFRQAAEKNASDPRRTGNTVDLPKGKKVLVSGDLHGNRRNLTKILGRADLSSNPDQVVVFQEIIHGPVDPRAGVDRSIELLLRVARLKISNPEQVVVIMGNHDLAQFTGNEITKSGRGVCKGFVEGIHYAMGGEDTDVVDAVNTFLASLPMAVRCPNGVFVCHTLPTPNRMKFADPEIFRRNSSEEDLHRGGPVYEWTWGRKHTPEQVEELAQRLDVSFFILGHKHMDVGYELISPRAVNIVSDHGHGAVVEFATDQSLDLDTIESYIKPIAAL
ncbi:MAG: metallophosphoesterase [Phycisphaerae bacterium]